MSKVIIALLILFFSFTFLLLLCILFMIFAILIFSRKRVKPILRPETKGN